MKSRRIALGILVILIISSIYYLEGQKAASNEGKPISINEPLSESMNQNPKNIVESAVSLEEAKNDTKIRSMGMFSEEDRKRIELKERQYLRAPELVGITGILNSENDIHIADYLNQGKVVMIDFWTYTCINCIRTLPHLVEWDKKYRDKGLIIIGVHTPEFEFEKKYDNVKMAIEKYGIGYPVVQDNNYKTWRAFKNNYWPRKYIIDPDGFIRYDHIGEGGYKETERLIQLLLEETGAVSQIGVSELEDLTPKSKQTPELYSGYDFALPRGQNIGNEVGLKPDEIWNYTMPKSIASDKIYLDGLWLSNPDNLESKNAASSIILDYTSTSVNIVAFNMSSSVKLEAFLDGEYLTAQDKGSDVIFEGKKSVINVNEPRLYNVVKKRYGKNVLKLTANASGFGFSAFTFG